jgi:hypothetical protein
MIRVSEGAHKALKSLSERTGESLQATLDRVVEEHRRMDLLRRANEAFAALRANPETWSEELQERAAWECTLADGLDDR